MEKKAPCLFCKKSTVAKRWHPFCGESCAAKYAVQQFDNSTLYCQEHGWVTWSSTDTKKKPVCGFEHKKTERETDERRKVASS